MGRSLRFPLRLRALQNFRLATSRNFVQFLTIEERSSQEKQVLAKAVGSETN